MLTDRKEAFRHNSCKKLAQLAKVIFTMATQIRDRQANYREMAEETDLAIQAIVASHRESLTAIGRSLAHFRKDCLDGACREWGAQYRDVKNGLTALASAQEAKFTQLACDAAQLSQSLKQMQLQTLTMAKRALIAADTFSQTIPSKLNAPVSVDVRPIMDKMEAFRKESEARMRALTAAHMKEIAKNRAAIAKLLKAELSRRRGPFLEIRSKLSTLEGNVKELRSKYSEVVKGRTGAFQKYKSDRAKLMTETKELHQLHRQKMGQIKDQQKLAMRNHAAEVADLKQQLLVEKRNHRAELDAISQEIEREKRHQKEHSDSHTGTMQKWSSESDTVSLEMTRQWTLEMKRRKDFHKASLTYIADCEVDTERLMGVMKRDIATSLEKVAARVIVFKNRAEAGAVENRARLEAQKAEVVKRGREKQDSLQSAIDARVAADGRAETNQKALIQQLKQSLEEVKRSQVAELGKQRDRFTVQVREIKKDDESKSRVRKGELQAALERRKAEKARRLQEMLANFQGEIAHRTTAFDTERLKRVADLRAEERLPPVETEKAHQLALSQANAGLDFATRRLVTLREEHGKKCAGLQAEVTKLEKAKREFERRKKTETSSIDQKYEVEIQIEQVKVSNSMDNIAKLYDTAENQRGCEIIEAIRRIREVNNAVNDFLLRKQRDLKAPKTATATVRTDLTSRNARLRENARETELQAAIDAVEGRRRARIAYLETHVNAKLAETRAAIDQYRKSHQETVTSLHTQICSENSDFKSQTAQIQAEAANLAKLAQGEMAPIDAGFDRTVQKLNKEHLAAVESIKRRIEAAGKQRDEVGRKYASEEAAERAQGRAELAQRGLDNAQLNVPVVPAVTAQADELNGKIAELTKKAKDAELRASQPPSRRGDRKGIDNKYAKIENFDDLIEKSFSAFYGMIRDAPGYVRERELSGTPMSPRSPNNSNGSPNGARNSRKEVTRVFTPIETSNLKRKGHVALAQVT
jgi:hypothetical protein